MNDTTPPDRAPSARHVLRHAELQWTSHAHGSHFAATHAAYGSLLGLKQLGARRVRVPPGKAAWPAHVHLANEELFFILAGRGRYRIGDETFEVAAGDCLHGPADPTLPHQLTNNGDVELEYLCISTMREPDVLLYPDSGCFAAFAGSAPGGAKGERSFEYFGTAEGARDYWHSADESARP